MTQNKVLNIIEFTKNPPKVLRTSTRNEKRYFMTQVKVDGNRIRELNCSCCVLKLQICISGEAVGISGLEGNVEVLLTKENEMNKSEGDWWIDFPKLSTRLSSLKLNEQEFCILAKITDQHGNLISSALSTPFYTYSHTKVLTRRQIINLRLISPNQIIVDPLNPVSKAVVFHVVGKQFIKSDRLKVIFKIICTKYENKKEEELIFSAVNVEHYSENVLFFEFPMELAEVLASKNAKLNKCMCQVTNDGNNFSNPLEIKILENDPANATLSELQNLNTNLNSLDGSLFDIEPFFLESEDYELPRSKRMRQLPAKM